MLFLPPSKAVRNEPSARRALRASLHTAPNQLVLGSAFDCASMQNDLLILEGWSATLHLPRLTGREQRRSLDVMKDSLDIDTTSFWRLNLGI
jgi:hypothetical protein